MGNLFVITIGREYGSGGRQIGQQLAKMLNISFYDKELIEEASRRSGVSCDFLERADEKAPNLLDYALLGSFGNESVLSNGNFYVLQSNVILSLAKEKSCVIVGRSADYILRNHPHCINLFIHAPEEFRKQQIAQRLAVDLDEAESVMGKHDRSRAKFYNFYTDKVWGKAASYHLSIDSSVLGMEDTAAYLYEFVQNVLKLKK
ncbi:MAG: cytidylate kinase-like family protein [Bacteroidales bacterium]